MKKQFLLTIMCFLMCLTMMVGCGKDTEGTKDDDSKASVGANSNDDKDDSKTEATPVPELPVEKFIANVKDGKYKDAVETYNNEIYGDASLEHEAESLLIEFCDDTNKGVLEGTCTEGQAEIVINTVGKVVDETGIIYEEYDAFKTTVTGSLASRAAYKAATELESLKNYGDAIESYKAVIEEDSNYADAQTAITRCSDAFRQEVFDKAAELAGNGNYIEAINKLKDAEAKLPEDSEITAKITVYEKTYISNAISSAEEAFVDPVKDFETALSHINGALQYYSENEELIAKKEYYESFRPVNIYDMDVLRGDAYTLATDEDTYGATYEKCFVCYAWSSTDVVFNLDKKYNTFNFTVYSRSNETDSYECFIQIYLDGVLAYENLSISDNGKSFDINIDVTGASEINICIDDGSSYSGIGMTDMILQRTVK